MAGYDPMDRKKIERLRLESRVRILVRRELYRRYPREASPAHVDRATRMVMDWLAEGRR